MTRLLFIFVTIAALTTGAHAQCPCDRTSDGTVDVTDLLNFLPDWFAQDGTTVPVGTGADFNEDGSVFVDDLLDFLSCWFPSSSVPPVGPCAEDPWIDGIATVYGTGEGGNCGWDSADLDVAPSPGRIAAVGSSNWDNGLGCGEVYEVRCVGSTNTIGVCQPDPFLVMVVDQCPECTDTHFDLSILAYDDLWNGTPGVIDIQFRKVTGAFTGNVAIDIKAGSSAFFVELYAKFPNKKIAGVELRGSNDAAYRPMTHVFNQGFWRLSPVTPPIQLPISVRLTAEDGSMIEGIDTITTFDTGNRDLGTNF